MSWNSYNAFMNNLGSGGHLAPTLIVLAGLMVLALVMGRRSRRRSP